MPEPNLEKLVNPVTELLKVTLLPYVSNCAFPETKLVETSVVMPDPSFRIPSVPSNPILLPAASAVFESNCRTLSLMVIVEVKVFVPAK